MGRVGVAVERAKGLLVDGLAEDVRGMKKDLERFFFRSPVRKRSLGAAALPRPSVGRRSIFSVLCSSRSVGRGSRRV